ncbi:ethanolamine kinase 1-like [Saccoglossus kowalevskii]|uniref:ethanolamine kinase n=1 Tax=Saccoglossus kowalevskii TaxID=10224 RepID=A0ABM0GTU3_SACKO|nr:PREDICTED: ethanolamine kinase 1-like [Saccoglossus kowalevskii]
MATTVCKLDVTVDANNPRPAALEIMKHVRPYWKGENVQLKVFTGGNTNKIFGCYLDENERQMVLLRVFGKKSEIMIDRKREIRNFQILHRAKCGAELYCIFNNGLCYQFIPGSILDADLVRNDKVYPLIAHKMARIHAIKPEDGETVPEPSTFQSLRRYLQNFPRQFEDPEKNASFKKEIVSHEQLGKEIDELEAALKPLNSPMVFCHNDLLLANIIYDEQTNMISFIDYEYGAFNYQAFDIANHFNEYAGVWTALDYNRYPEKEYQLKWLHKYLSDWYTMRGINKYVTKKDTEILYVQVNKFALVSHLSLSMWAIIQAAHSDIDFDFLQYGILRFSEYFKRKEEFLPLEMPI